MATDEKQNRENTEKTNKKTCMKFQFIFLLRLNVCDNLAEAMKAMDEKKQHTESSNPVKISDICGEMNPLVFSALEEVNLVFILMMSSTVMVDIVFIFFRSLWLEFSVQVTSSRAHLLQRRVLVTA